MAEGIPGDLVFVNIAALNPGGRSGGRIGQPHHLAQDELLEGEIGGNSCSQPFSPTSVFGLAANDAGDSRQSVRLGFCRA